MSESQAPLGPSSPSKTVPAGLRGPGENPSPSLMSVWCPFSHGLDGRISNRETEGIGTVTTLTRFVLRGKPSGVILLCFTSSVKVDEGAYLLLAP